MRGCSTNGLASRSDVVYDCGLTAQKVKEFFSRCRIMLIGPTGMGWVEKFVVRKQLASGNIAP
jgi:hypothetical protein